MNKNILKYQQLDLKQHQLKKQLLNSKEKTLMNEMIADVKKAQSKSISLESKANKLIKDYTALKLEYDKNFELIKKLTSKNVEDVPADEIDSVLHQINLISSNLYMIERNLNINVNLIQNILKEFEATKQSVIKTKTKYKESQKRYEVLCNELNPKIDELKQDMQALEKDIDLTLLEKYKTLKKDKVFPVFVPLENGNCGGCRMMQPKDQLDKLKTESFIVCEHCGRIIYND